MTNSNDSRFRWTQLFFLYSALMMSAASCSSVSSPAPTTETTPAEIREESSISVSTLRIPSAIPINDQNHLVYELIIDNATLAPVKLSSVEISAGSFGQHEKTTQDLQANFRLLQNVDVDTLPDLRQLGPQKAASDLSLPSKRKALIFLWLTAEEETNVPNQIQHRICLVKNDGPECLEFNTQVDSSAPVVVSPPLSGPGWIPARGGPSPTSGHRRTVLKIAGSNHLPQRFAIDWVRIGSNGSILKVGGSATKNQDFWCFGEPVLAVADGTVVSSRNDLPDNPGVEGSETRPIEYSTISGNHVIIDIGNNAYVFYAHLQEGSVRVAEGDSVIRGQVIGFLGNSGNSSGPHLHFHICDRASAVECEGIPYVFDEYSRREASIEGDGSPENSRLVPTTEREPIKGQLISYQSIIDFAE